jgi:hypothetical protein
VKGVVGAQPHRFRRVAFAPGRPLTDDDLDPGVTMLPVDPVESDHADDEIPILEHHRPDEILFARRHAFEPPDLLCRRRWIPAEQVARDFGVSEPAGEGGEILKGRGPSMGDRL